MARGNSRRNVEELYDAPIEMEGETSQQPQPENEELRNRTQRVEEQLEQVVGILHGMAANMQRQNQPTPPAAVVPEDRPTSILKEFQRLNPTEFAGTEEPLDAERWFMGILVPLCHQTYARVVHTARVIEADWESSQKSREQNNKNKKQKTNPPNKTQGQGSKAQQHNTELKCFKCKQPGHLKRNCPLLNQGEQPRPQQHQLEWRPQQGQTSGQNQRQPPPARPQHQQHKGLNNKTSREHRVKFITLHPWRMK
ncbi:zinc finger protein [Macleaya cordata]|uniref:Zinc finger protein n=1 Tax=Macleaya cordata TaxID=56857 RepID=A0A200PQC8_MACCD|nr:zinc finger protein [Macleaya cordata]